MTYLLDSLCREIISGFSPKFDLLSQEQQQISVVSLLQSLNSRNNVPPPPRSPKNKPRSPKNNDALDACSTQSLNEPESTNQKINNEELLLLASLYPFPVPSDYLSDVLNLQCGGCLQTAANRILEETPEDVKTDLAAWETAQQKKANGSNMPPSPDTRAVLRPDEELRRSIVARFHLEVVPAHSDTSATLGKGGPTKAQSVAAWGAQGGSGGTSGKKAQMRYREGVVVSTKGDKVS